MGTRCCSLRRLHFLKAKAESSSSVLATHRPLWRRLWLVQTLLHLHQKSLLQLVGADWERGTARGKLKSNDERLEKLKSKCSTFTAYAPRQDSLALFLGLGILGVKPSLSVLKIETNSTTVNLNLLWGNKNQNNF